MTSPMTEALSQVQAINRKLDEPAKSKAKPKPKPAAKKSPAPSKAKSKPKASPKPKASKRKPKSTEPRILKRDQMVALLSRPSGATTQELMDVHGTQPHSVRAVISGLRKAGHKVETTSEGTKPTITTYRLLAD